MFSSLISISISILGVFGTVFHAFFRGTDTLLGTKKMLVDPSSLASLNIKLLRLKLLLRYRLGCRRCDR